MQAGRQAGEIDQGAAGLGGGVEKNLPLIHQVRFTICGGLEGLIGGFFSEMEGRVIGKGGIFRDFCWGGGDRGAAFFSPFDGDFWRWEVGDGGRG